MSEYIQRAWLNHRTHSSVWLFRGLFVSRRGVEGSVPFFFLIVLLCSKSFQDSRAQLLLRICSTIQSIVFHSQFISIAFIHTSHLLHISPFTFFAYIKRTRNIFSSLMMPLIVESLAFGFCIF